MAAVENLGQTFTLQPKTKHEATVIFFHGLGDTGQGWCDTMKSFQRVGFPHVKFICPTAPTLPVTLNFGMQMPAWFDILSLQKDGPIDKAGITKSKLIVEHFVKEEVKNGIPASKIVVGGFSQGGAISLFGALQCTEGKLAGVMALSGFLPFDEGLTEHTTQENKETPVFMGHGDADPVVNYSFGRGSYEHLKEKGFNVDFHTYNNLGHSVDAAELEDVRKFLLQVLGSPSS